MLRPHSKPDFPPVYSCRIPFLFGWTAALCDTGDFPEQTHWDLRYFPLANEPICLVGTYNIMRDLCRQSLPLQWQLRRFSTPRAAILCPTYSLRVSHPVASDANWMHEGYERFLHCRTRPSKQNKLTADPRCTLGILLVCPRPRTRMQLHWPRLHIAATAIAKHPVVKNQVTHSTSKHKPTVFLDSWELFSNVDILEAVCRPPPPPLLYTLDLIWLLYSHTFITLI